MFDHLARCLQLIYERSCGPARQTFLGYADHVGDSLIFKWDGAAFLPFQSFAPKAGRCFRFFTIDEKYYVAFASIQGDSILYRWDGQKFQFHQKLSGPSGREFRIVRTET